MVLRADATDLYNKGVSAMATGDYRTAAQSFDEIIQNYPSTTNIDDVRLQAGVAHLHLGEYDEAVDRLAKEAGPSGFPGNRATALYYTGIAELSAANKIPEGAARIAKFRLAGQTLQQLIDFVTAHPSPENQNFAEDAYYNQSVADFYASDLPGAEKDLQFLLQQYPASLGRPDYLLLMGNLYTQEASKAFDDKKPDDEVKAIAQRAIGAFDEVINDPNALIQANEAVLAKAEVLYFLGSFDLPSTAGYAKALDAFRQVRRKDDLIPLQQAHLNDLIAKNQAQMQASGGTSLNTKSSRIIDRETGRLAHLKSGPDPIIQALMRIAECYNSMKEGDEARTVLHRLEHADLTKDQHQEVDFALINSYVLGGQEQKADQALTAFLAQHPGDTQAEGIRLQLADSMMKAKDYSGALAQANRNLQDFPHGPNVAQAIELKAEALTSLGRLDEARKVEDDFLRENPNNASATGLLVSRAQGEAAQGDFKGALADYEKIRDSHASPELQADGAAGYIQTLQSLGRTDDIIRESKAFVSKYPTSPALPSVLAMSGVALAQKNEAGAVTALQDVAHRFPQDSTDSPAPFALFYIVNIYQRAGKIPEMIKAAAELQKRFPQRYSLLLQADDMVSAAYLKQKKFDLAASILQPLANTPQPEIAAQARAKIGDVWLKAARAMGAYQSMERESDRTEAQKRLGAAEQAFLGVLKDFPDQLNAVDDAFRGLDSALAQRRSWGLLKPADFENYFTKLTAGLTDPVMKARVELAKASLIFLGKKGGLDQYPTALARFRAAINASPGLTLTRFEATHYGDLLLAAKDYPTAIQVYTTLLNSTNEPQTQAEAYYGLGATYLEQGDLAQAKTYFEDMKKLPGGAAWSSHIIDAGFGLARIDELSGQPANLAKAKQTYADIIQSGAASVPLQAQAMLGYGRILEAEGHALRPATPGTIEYAVHYYQQVDTIFGPAVPELSAEGLYDAGQAYDKAGDKANAQKQYQAIQVNYGTTAPDWALKAQESLAKDQ